MTVSDIPCSGGGKRSMDADAAAEDGGVTTGSPSQKPFALLSGTFFTCESDAATPPATGWIGCVTAGLEEEEDSCRGKRDDGEDVEEVRS